MHRTAAPFARGKKGTIVTNNEGGGRWFEEKKTDMDFAKKIRESGDNSSLTAGI